MSFNLLAHLFATILELVSLLVNLLIVKKEHVLFISILVVFGNINTYHAG